jgi:hypothetical protein
VDRRTVESLCATSMDFLIVSAITTIDLQKLPGDLQPFLLSCAAGITWTVPSPEHKYGYRNPGLPEIHLRF